MTPLFEPGECQHEYADGGFCRRAREHHRGPGTEDHEFFGGEFDTSPTRPAMTHPAMELADAMRAALNVVFEERGLAVLRNSFGWDRHDVFEFTLRLARKEDKGRVWT
jgi:hypothetical protein